MINVNPNKIGIERYRMPRVECQTQRNNKTYIKNLDKISKALNRTEEQILKYIGFVLSTQTNIKDLSINGVYDSDKLQTLINEFIKSYVLCKVCENPETKIDGGKKLGCQACGKVSLIAHSNSKFESWLLK